MLKAVRQVGTLTHCVAAKSFWNLTWMKPPGLNLKILIRFTSPYSIYSSFTRSCSIFLKFYLSGNLTTGPKAYHIFFNLEVVLQHHDQESLSTLLAFITPAKLSLLLGLYLDLLQLVHLLDHSLPVRAFLFEHSLLDQHLVAGLDVGLVKEIDGQLNACSRC